jgi:ATP-dependent Lon protease
MKKKDPTIPGRRQHRDVDAPRGDLAAVVAGVAEVEIDDARTALATRPNADRLHVHFDPSKLESVPRDAQSILWPVWQPGQMMEVVDRHNAGGGDGGHREDMARRLRQAISRPPIRFLSWADPERLRALRDGHGQFAEVLDLCDDAMAANPTAPIPPVLLVSEPGLGKTFFAQALAACLQAPMHLLDAASLTSNAMLLGCESLWSTASPGRIYSALVEGDAADPVFIVDEIDKASRNPAHDPVQQLHAVLEPSSAARLTDQYVGLELDGRRIRWVLTANTVKPIPQSLLSRVHVVHVRRPGAREMLGIARSVAAAVIARQAPVGFQPLPRAVIVDIAELAPRVQRMVLTRAVQRAVSAGRDHVVLEDLHVGSGATAPRVLH